ncbi:MAG: ATP-binding cassette domain-containing protein [Rhodobacteraceae bacterium]|nr:ATP-binding cassette domain-containing protein [Paracoccaceae bacterium]
MLRLTDISFSIEGRPLFEEASATIPTGHKVGFVGRNGTGKTTLFHLINGVLALDGGTVETPKRARIGGVAQEAPASSDSLLDTVLAADVERAELLARAETEQDPNQIAEIYTRLGDIDAYSAEARAASILHGLGFDGEAQLQPCSDFSGGWRMRVALAAVLFSEPDILLLDEPTNYLDLEGTLWLEGYLAKYPHTVLVISHDRALLNRSVNAILHLNERKLTLYQGNYDTFDATRRAKLAEQASMARKQQAARDHMMSYVDRFRAQASKAKQAQSRLKMLERMEPISAAIENRVSAFNFPSPEQLSPPIIKLEDVAVGYDGTPVLKGLDLRIDQDDRIALLGANGQGKSTLSKLLAGRLKPLNGKIVNSSKLRIGYFAQHQVDELHLDETPLQHLARALPGQTPGKLRARLAGGGLGAEQVETVVGRLSGGQKARLSMLLATLDAPHLVILDEPTNHLDIESRDALVQALTAYEGAVILVSHDPFLVNAVADRLWLVKNGGVTPYLDDLDAYAKMLLSERGAGGAKAAQVGDNKRNKKKNNAGQRKQTEPLKMDVAKAEERVSKLEEMLQKMDVRLTEADLYTPAMEYKLKQLQKKRVEIQEGLQRAESIWMDAQKKLDDTKG